MLYTDGIENVSCSMYRSGIRDRNRLFDIRDHELGVVGVYGLYTGDLNSSIWDFYTVYRTNNRPFGNDFIWL